MKRWSCLWPGAVNKKRLKHYCDHQYHLWSSFFSKVWLFLKLFSLTTLFLDFDWKEVRGLKRSEAIALYRLFRKAWWDGFATFHNVLLAYILYMSIPFLEDDQNLKALIKGSDFFEWLGIMYKGWELSFLGIHPYFRTLLCFSLLVLFVIYLYPLRRIVHYAVKNFVVIDLRNLYYWFKDDNTGLEKFGLILMFLCAGTVVFFLYPFLDKFFQLYLFCWVFLYLWLGFVVWYGLEVNFRFFFRFLWGVLFFLFWLLVTLTILGYWVVVKFVLGILILVYIVLGLVVLFIWSFS